jgi:tetratricopeptide (TPR) repeat protein
VHTAKAYQANFDMAELYIRTGKIEDALAEYDAAVRIKPDFAEAYYNRANALLVHHDIERAKLSFRKAIEVTNDPKIRASAFNALKTVEQLVPSPTK